MGTLGQYLRSAREARDIDLRDAAQQTRISFNYLKALEDEDFSKLPGEVFVRGFLKNYGKFLKLDETELLEKYAEVQPKRVSTPSQNASNDAERKSAATETATASRETPIEPFVWGAIITLSLLVLLFTALPAKHIQRLSLAEKNQDPAAVSGDPAQGQPEKPDKLYLEVVAMDDTWLLVRTDTSPQKKAVLKKGESLIWSADERFLLSYGKISALKLLLNGEELPVRGPAETPVRDLAVTHAGIINQPAPLKPLTPARPKLRQAVPVAHTSGQAAPVAQTTGQAAPAAAPLEQQMPVAAQPPEPEPEAQPVSPPDSSQ